MNDDILDVLIVEDNPGDAYMINEMLQNLKMNLSISVAEDGQEALDILNDQKARKPGLMILDLNMPRVNGFEVLEFMRSSPTLNKIPVVVMTGSLRKADEQTCLCLGAVGYCIKPASSEEMVRSGMCLRSHLEPLSRGKGKIGNSISSVKVSLYEFHGDEADIGIPLVLHERFVMDAFTEQIGQTFDLWRWPDDGLEARRGPDY
jgi:chemotaxis family two-component system response regulator Rcp1